MTTKRHKTSPEVRKAIERALLEGTKSGSAIAAEFGVSKQLVSRIAGQGRKNGSGGPEPLGAPEKLAREALMNAGEDPEIDSLIEQGNVEWLRSVRDNQRAPWAERTKCAIALARIERKDVVSTTFVAPEGVAWAEALAAAISEQPDEVRRKVLEILGAPVPTKVEAEGT